MHLDLSIVLHGQYHDWLVSGFFLSLELLGLALAFAMPLAILIAVISVLPWGGRILANTYVQLVRNIPLLVHILFWYYGAPEILPETLKHRIYQGDVEVVSAVIALATYSAAYMSEEIRSGIRAIPNEQMESGRALGFSLGQTLRWVILPQALRAMTGPLLNQTLNLWKNTSVAMVIGVQELMFQAQQVESVTFRGFEAFGFVSVAYALVSIIILALSSIISSRKMRRQ